MLALICTVDPTTGFTGTPVTKDGPIFRDAAMRGTRDDLKTDARSRRSRSLNDTSKDFVSAFLLGTNRLVRLCRIDMSEPGWIAAVFVPVTCIGIVLAATFVLLNGMSAYSDAEAPPPRQSEAFSAVVSAWTPPTSSCSAVVLLQTGAGMLTMIWAAPDFVSLVAVMIAVPAATAVTRPVASTVALLGLEDAHVMTRPVSTLLAASFVVA